VNPKKVRFTPLDGLLIAALLAGAAFLAHRVAGELHYRWDWPALLPYLLHRQEEGWAAGTLLTGFVMTVKLSLWAMLLATLLGTFAGLLRVGRGPLGRLAAGSYVELVRNLPPLVLIFIVYFFIGERVLALLGVEDLLRAAAPGTRELLAVLFAPPERLPGFFAGLATLVLYEAAYIAEIVRAGIQSIERGQWEAARALGMTRAQQLRLVILPQAIRRVLPALAGQFISTIKDSAIVSVVSIPELTFQGLEVMAATYRTFEVWITIAALYFLLTFACSLGVRRLEISLRSGGN
jgi:polar amino acid transport system permease protein